LITLKLLNPVFITALKPLKPKNRPLLNSQTTLGHGFRITDRNQHYIAMNREDKIRYIRESRFYSLAYRNLETCTEGELDDMIRMIVRELQKEEVSIQQNMETTFQMHLN